MLHDLRVYVICILSTVGLLFHPLMLPCANRSFSSKLVFMLIAIAELSCWIIKGSNSTIIYYIWWKNKAAFTTFFVIITFDDN